MKNFPFFLILFFLSCRGETQPSINKTIEEEKIIENIISIMEKDFFSCSYDFFYYYWTRIVEENDEKKDEEVQLIYSEEMDIQYTFAIRYDKDGYVTRIVALWGGEIIRDEEDKRYGDYMGGKVVEISSEKLTDKEKIKFMSFLIKKMNIEALSNEIFEYSPALHGRKMPYGTGNEEAVRRKLESLANIAELFDWPYLKDPYVGASDGELLKKYLKK